MKNNYSFLQTSLLLVMLFLANDTRAQRTENNLESSPASIAFIGLEDNMLVFDLHLALKDLSTGSLRILDGNNAQLFSERILKHVATKRYKIVRDDLDKIKFELVINRSVFRQSFDVATRFQEVLEVTRVE